jgi:hypothetical protein
MKNFQEHNVVMVGLEVQENKYLYLVIFKLITKLVFSFTFCKISFLNKINKKHSGKYEISHFQLGSFPDKVAVLIHTCIHKVATLLDIFRIMLHF